MNIEITNNRFCCTRCHAPEATSAWMRGARTDPKAPRRIEGARRSLPPGLCDECLYDLAPPETSLPSLALLASGEELVTEAELSKLCGCRLNRAGRYTVPALSSNEVHRLAMSLQGTSDACVRTWPTAQWLYPRSIALRSAARLYDALSHLDALLEGARELAYRDADRFVDDASLEAEARTQRWSAARLRAAVAAFQTSFVGGVHRTLPPLPAAPRGAHEDFLRALNTVRISIEREAASALAEGGAS